MGLRAAWSALWGRETKASGAGRLIGLTGTGPAVLMPRRFDAFAEEGYRRNVVVYRAVNEVARGAASVPWRLFRREGDNAAERLEAHPLLDLLARPNPMMARSELIEALLGYLLIAGNGFLEAVASEGGAAPRELWPLRPDRMTVLKSESGLPSGYLYRVGGRETRWAADPAIGRSAILHLRSFNPLDDWYGLSAVEPAALGIDQHNEAGKWNTALMQNGARPSGAIVYEPKEGQGNLDDLQFARVKNEIEEQYAGAKNAGRPMLLEGGLSWQEMSLSPKDMDFLDAKHSAARDIALAFGVPPQLLGIPGDNTYANYQEARLALWEQTIVPLLRHLRDELNAWLAPAFGEGLALELDLDEVPALLPRREARWEMVRGWADSGLMTINEAREAIGLGPVEGGDVAFVSASKLPFSEDLEDPTPPPEGGTFEEEARRLYQDAYGDSLE